MATSKQRTPNFKFVLPRFNQQTWQDDYYDNMRSIDGILSRFFGIANYVGIWQNSTTYNVGDRVLDADQALIYEVLVQHTTDPEPTTFAEFRASNRTFYEVFTTEVQFRGEWEPDTDYAAGDFVLYAPANDTNKFAQVTTAYTSSNDFDTDVSNGNLEVLLSAAGLNNAEVASLESINTTGLIVRQGTANHGTVTITFSGDGVSITDGDGVGGNPTLSLANDLAALEGLGSTGFAVRSGTDTWVQRAITTPNSGISVSNGNGVNANPSVVPADDLAAVEALSSNGIAVRTGSNTWTIRDIVGGDGVSVTNGDGVAGNPSVAVDSTVLRDSEIGSVVQGYDADTLFADTTDVLNAGFFGTGNALSISSGQTSIDARQSHIRTLTVNADTEIQVPSNQDGGFSIIVIATNDSTGGYNLTFASGYTELAANLGYNDAANAVNIIQIIGDGSNVWYSITGEA